MAKNKELLGKWECTNILTSRIPYAALAEKFSHTQRSKKEAAAPSISLIHKISLSIIYRRRVCGIRKSEGGFDQLSILPFSSSLSSA